MEGLTFLRRFSLFKVFHAAQALYYFNPGITRKVSRGSAAASVFIWAATDGFLVPESQFRLSREKDIPPWLPAEICIKHTLRSVAGTGALLFLLIFLR